jgi:cytochrome c-type biogenesis protein CcmH
VLSHLLAPCCWKQTLDVHDSDLARALRAEVRARLIAGEAPSSVEQGLVVRYGEGIRAVPLADPTPKAALIGLAAVVVAGVALTLVVRRRARATPPAPHRTARDEWDVALDDELRDAD